MVKKIKNFTIFILTCLIIFISIGMRSSFAATDYSKEMDFLSTLGLGGINSSVTGGIPTRAETSIWLAKSLGMADDSKPREKIFNDVETDNMAFGAISYLYDSGIVIGNTDGNFYPDRQITFDEFVKMTVTSLGYKDYAIAKGGYKKQYLDCARSSGIIKGVDINGEFTKGKIFAMLYNLLHAQKLTPGLIKADTTSDDYISEYKKGDTLLKEIYGIEKNTGIVMANKTGCIYGNDILNDGFIMIDYKTYKLIKPIEKDCLGMKVDYYINTDGNILFAVLGKNDKHIIMHDNILPNSTPHTIYYEADNKNKTLNIASNAFYSYNGIQILPNDSDMKPKYGKIELIDNNDDNKMDIVKIWDYKSYVTKAITNDNIYLYENLQNISAINYTDKNIKTVVLDKALNVCEVSINLDKDNVITVAESKDKKSRIIFLSVDNLEGTLTEITQKNKAIIDEYEYSIYNGVDLSDCFNKSLTYYLDINETIIKVSQSEEEKYAVLYGIKMGDTIDGEMSIKLYDSGKFTVYACSDKVQISTGGNNFISYDQEKAYRIIKAEFDNEGKQLIKFSLRDNKINRLVIAEKNKETDNDVFRMNIESEEGHTYTAYREYLYDDKVNESGGRDNIRWIPKSTFIYIVSENEIFCSFGTCESIIGLNGSPKYSNFKAYDISEVGVCKYIVIDASVKTMADVTYDSDVAFITDVKTILDESGDSILEFSALSSMDEGDGVRKVKLKTRNDELKNSTRERLNGGYKADTINFYDLKTGDVINFVKDGISDEVTGFVVIARLENILGNMIASSANYSASIWDACTTGVVTAVDYYGVQIKNDTLINNNYGNYLTITRCSDYPVRDLIAKYSSQTGEITLATWDDIQVGTKLWNYTKSTYSFGGKYFIIIE